MSVARLIKTGTSLLSGQGIQVINQLLLPPLFLRHYGTGVYGQWIALSAAAQYLGTLNFGLHNFASNHATIAYNRSDLEEVNVIQATSFAIVLGIVSLAAVLALLVFFVPVSSVLHLTISNTAAATTIYLLGAQFLVRLIFGFLQTAFLVIGAFHRGSNWNNGLAVATLAFSAVCVLFHAPFVWIAAGQLLATLIFAVLVGIDLYLKAPVAFPRLQYTRRSRVIDILKPSGYYGMLFSASFLVYQLPVVIMQRMLGPTPVVVFSITRTIYSMSRQVLTAFSSALGPEITELFGRGNWRGLFNLYDLSERAVFALVPLVTLGTFLATPALMAIWVHKPELFQPEVCIFMALISAAAGIKEHKYQFQIAINHHSEMARFMFFTYVAMVVASIPAVARFGIRGFLALWLVTESVQIIYTVRLNQRLFKEFCVLEMAPLYRVAAVVAAGMAACWWLSAFIRGYSALLQLACSCAFALLLLAVEYPIFGLAELRTSLVERFSRRAAAQEELTSVA